MPERVSWIPIKKSIDFYILTLLLIRQPQYGSVNLMFDYHQRAAKLLSACIASLFVVSSFVGMIAVAPVVSAVPGDWTINGPVTISDTAAYYVDGNVTITSSGTLTLRNATMVFLNDVNHKHTLTVDGKLIMDDGASITTITTFDNPYQVKPWPLLPMIVQNGANVTISGGSSLQFPGWLNITGSTTKFTMSEESIITALDPIATAKIDTVSVNITLDRSDNSPAISIYNATFEMYRSAILYSPRGENHANIVLTGIANFTAVDSMIDVDFTYNDPPNHVTLDLSGHANAYLYGSVFQRAVPNPADSAISSTTTQVNSVPTAKHPTWDNSTQTLTNLYNEEGLVYQILPQRNLAVTTFNLTPIQSSDILAVTLVTKYSVTSDYVGTRAINYTLNGVTRPTTIVPVANFNGRKTCDLYSKGVDNRTEINTLRISFFNNGNTGTGNVQFDSIYLTVVTGPQTYIYRWGELNVTDQYTTPLSGASLSAKFNGSDWLGGQNVYYYTPTGIQPNPPANILNYMGKTTGNYKLTDSIGHAMIPYLTDIVYGNALSGTMGTWPNSLTIMTNVTATYTNSNSEFLMFNPYPAIRTFADTQMLLPNGSIAIQGVSAPTWDHSKYLIVPPSLTLTGAYSLDGDVLVKPAGVLTLQGMDFTVYRNIGETQSAKITVFNGGTLNIVDSNLISDVPLTLEVKAGGTLTIAGSVIDSSVNITARGNAAIQITDSEIGGQLTFASDATMTSSISDVTFSNSPSFGGSSTVNLVNVTAPSILQTENSRVNLYRYVEIGTLDMSGASLSGANVIARFPGDASTRASAISNATGFVDLKLLVCRMNASGGVSIKNDFRNYVFNASYVQGVLTYYADEQGISLTTYTAPLDVENPAISMTIPLEFADLTFGIGGITAVSSLSTGVLSEGLNTTITASITNSGTKDIAVGDRFNVTFYYDSVTPANRLGIYNITSGLGAGATTSASIVWVNTPVGPHTVFVSINPPGAFREVNESDYSNNNGSVLVNVETRSDLIIHDMYAMYNGGKILTNGAIPSDRSISLYVNIQNIGNTPVSSEIAVILYNGTTVSAANIIAHTSVTTTMYKGDSPIPVIFDVQVPPINASSASWHYTVVVNPSVAQGSTIVPIPEVATNNNNFQFNLTVLDSRPDPMVNATNIAVYINNNVELNTVGNNVTYASEIRVLVTVTNDGIDGVDQVSVSLDFNGTGTDAAVGITRGVNEAGGNVKYLDLNGTGQFGSSKTVEWIYTVTLSYAGPYRVNVTLDMEHAILNDKNRTNNNAWRMINVSYITPVITLFSGTPKDNVTAGETITVTGEVKYPITGSPMIGIDVFVEIRNGTNALIVTSLTATTTGGGIFSVQIIIPANTPSGQYKVVVVTGQTHAEVKTIKIIAQGGGIDLWLIIIIIAVVAAALAFTFYIYRKGVGKLVECGECGSLIPESAKKCPKCGVEFEEDMVKCSECGAWIPSDSLECSNCHVRFGTPLEGEKSYEDQMREQYENTVVQKYRDLAKGELGKTFNEESFQTWWAANPAYISFEDWLTKEETRREQLNLITCPVCGTPNPSGSTTCHNCGSPLDEGKGGSEGPEQVVVEKRVIRQPVDRKVVPKKVIKKPLEEQGQQKQQ
jgi:ribosomal protein L40E